MRLLPVAVRSGAEEQDVLGPRGEPFDEGKLRAARLQMMGLVDDDQIPITLRESFTDIDPQWADEELGVEQLFRQVLARDVNRAAAVGVFSHDPQDQVEAQVRLGQPLMYQGGRNQDEGVLHAFCQQHPVQNQQRLDRLAEPDFVGEQDAQTVAFADIASYRQLVVEEADAATQEAARRRG